MKKAFVEKYGPWALVTGGARGIGKAFAIELASKGLNIILVDIMANELAKTERELKQWFSVEVRAVLADLGEPSHVEHILRECENYAIGLFCCNHAASHNLTDCKLKFWLDTDWADLSKIYHVNLTSSIHLLYHLAQKMRQRQTGGIILVSSGGAFTGAPYLAEYAATKAFLSNLGESLWWELKQDNIDVLTVFPGLTKTPGMMKFINEQGEKKLPMMDPLFVAKKAIKALGKKISVVPGWKNRVQAFLSTRLLPKKVTISSLGKFLPRFFNVLIHKNHKDDE